MHFTARQEFQYLKSIKLTSFECPLSETTKAFEMKPLNTSFETEITWFDYVR